MHGLALTFIFILFLAVNSYSQSTDTSITQVKEEVPLPFTLKKIEGAELLTKNHVEKMEIKIPGFNDNVTGQVMGFFYNIPADLNLTLKEVFNSYKNDLKQEGFKVTIEDGQAPALLNRLCVDQKNFCGQGSFRSNRGSLTPDKPFEYDRFTSLVKKTPDGDIRISVVGRKVTSTGVFEWNKGGNKDALVDKKSFKEGDNVILVTIASPKIAKINMVKEDLNFMRDALSTKGSINLYGIYFDNSKADIKPESEATLNEIAKLLNADPSLNLDIVGHTHSIGDPALNQKLSEDRASAVVDVLVKKYGIDAKRLHAIGMGSSKPVADNETEEGRAKNRRVELIKK